MSLPLERSAVTSSLSEHLSAIGDEIREKKI